MAPRNKYHLFPNQEVTYIWEGKECKIQGIHKAPTMKYDKENNSWFRCEPEPDEQGRYYWNEPDLIAIVKAQKSFRCDICGRYSSLVTGHFYPYKILKPIWYVGLLDLEGCTVPEWGYTTKICLECATKIFKDAVVYECDGWDWGGWNAKTPEVKKPPINLREKIIAKGLKG